MTLTAHCRLGKRYVRDPIADLSQGGFYLRTKEPAKAGTPVRVALALPDKLRPTYCTLVGTVARVDRDERGRPLGLGVCFEPSEMAPPDVTALNTFLEAEAALVKVPV